MGGLFILVVIFLPKGLAGLAQTIKARLSRRQGTRANAPETLEFHGGSAMNAYLELRDVSVSFNGFRAVSDLNMSVQKGELRCLIGPNGAGKTTALDLICGKIKRTSGSIVLNGTALDLLEEYQIARAGVGRKFQVPSVFKELSVSENLKVAQKSACRRVE